MDGLALGLPARTHGVHLCPHVGQLPAQLLQAMPAHRILFLGEGRLLDLEPHGPAAQLVELGRERVDLGPQHRAGLVDQVDGLVGQESIGDVAVAQGDGGDQRSVLDVHAVEHLETLLQAAQDGDGVLDGGFVHEDSLKSPFERGVLFDVLAVLVEGGGADEVELSAGQHRLQHVAGIHGALGRASADHGVELVDEEDDAPFGTLHLAQDRLETLLELTAVLRPGHERAHVESEDRPVLKALGDVAAHDSLRQALDDGRLAHPGIADQDRVVLGLPRQDLDDAADLAVPPDDGIEAPVRASATRSCPYFSNAS